MAAIVTGSDWGIGRRAESRHLDLTDTDTAGSTCASTTPAVACRRAGGRIVNVTSGHEHVPLLGSTPYVVAKHGLGGLTRSLALEPAERDITVNSVAPGEIATA